MSALHGKPPDASETRHLAAYHQGFSLHAGVHLHANDRQGLAHLCGYGARPTLTQERLLRVFREDILACPCGGRRKVIA